MPETSNAQASYERQRDHELSRNVRGTLPSCYANPDSIDAWRHRRMHETILPLVDTYPNARWMTLGDGRFGSDAFFLQQHGLDVLASSLTTDALAVATEKGFIRKFKEINAEDIDLPRNAVDFTYCKESYHHFPRPYVAFYEMLRVSTTAVVLVEPQQGQSRFLDWAKNLIKTRIRGDQSTEFEAAGNFIFRVNVDEIMKMMKGLHYDTVVAIKPFNDFYYRRFSTSAASALSKPALLTKLAIRTQDLLCRLKLMDYGLAAVIAFKIKPGDDLKARLIRNGFKLHHLPKNPYR